MGGIESQCSSSCTITQHDHKTGSPVHPSSFRAWTVSSSTSSPVNIEWTIACELALQTPPLLIGSDTTSAVEAENHRLTKPIGARSGSRAAQGQFLHFAPLAIGRVSFLYTQWPSSGTSMPFCRPRCSSCRCWH